MTGIIGYNQIMNLLSVQGLGALYTFCILLICIVCIHIFKLARLGLKAQKKKEQKKEEPPQEPVYYLVEKKKSATQYKKPKKIKFQK